ncbi:MAG: hypothetical protein D6748_11700 [Calditrichaeota bacterium]|nr:MAG: hypothetical protein D6748_11700 [Calditrichota bacterium]
MGYFVREADIHQEKDVLLNLLTANRDRKNYPYEKRYDWLYLNNPYGEAIAWIIEDDKNHTPVGFTAVYPRMMLVNNQEMLVWNCGDFSIDRRFRTLGIALKLRKAAKNCVEKGEVPFLYAHPNDRMVHIHLKAGHQKIALMKRYALLINIAKVLRDKPFGAGISKIINPVLKGGLRFKNRKLGEFEIQRAKDAIFDHRYREICEELSKKYAIIGLRDETYLKWKFSDHPVFNYSVFNYYQQNKLKGYIIYTIEGDTVYLIEIVATQEFQKALLSTFIHTILTEYPEVYSVSTIQQEFNPVIPTLHEIGFRFRDDATSSVIAYTANPQLADFVFDGKQWFMNVGDRDA